MIDDGLLTADERDDPRRPEPRRRQFRTRSLFMLIVLAAVWMGVLVDPEIATLVLKVLGAFGLTLAVIGLAMGLGLVGFGLGTAGDRLIGWIRRAGRWPEE